jgi:hypothetical protein
MVLRKFTAFLAGALIGSTAAGIAVHAAPGTPEDDARALLIRYGECLDRRDRVACQQLFAPDGGLYFYKGRAAIGERLSKESESGAGSHQIVNVKFLPDGPDVAGVTSEMIVTRGSGRAKFGGDAIDRITYRYLDRITRIDGTWLFSHREAFPIAFQHGRKAQPEREPDPSFAWAARNLIGAYAECIDAHKPPACVADLFAAGGGLNQVSGRAAIMALIARVPTPNSSVSEVDSNPIFHQESPNRGSAVTDAMFYQKGDAAEAVWTARDRYFDQFILVDGKWLFSHREIAPVGQ